ncbi:hypothetical protein N7492_008219 [Penicillium capsulatum]|uniref:Uncharacterized protein n=1 Tax=Penicillium capsulatum TaxID=69766 RepID=A0A9W9HQC3_9EURO|nr:hypothetical protein N7492_008219 [Penicillium capsulatum]KAJ6105629.1 hypothetical protein N7512_009146 [Penicillium capsulatum]
MLEKLPQDRLQPLLFDFRDPITIAGGIAKPSGCLSMHGGRDEISCVNFDCHAERTAGSVWDITRCRVIPVLVAHPVLFAVLFGEGDPFVNIMNLVLISVFREENVAFAILDHLADNMANHFSFQPILDNRFEVAFLNGLGHLFSYPLTSFKHLPDVVRTGVLAFHGEDEGPLCLVEYLLCLRFVVNACFPLSVGFGGVFLEIFQTPAPAFIFAYFLALAASSAASFVASPPFLAASPPFAAASPSFLAASPPFAAASPSFSAAPPPFAAASPPFLPALAACAPAFSSAPPASAAPSSAAVPPALPAVDSPATAVLPATVESPDSTIAVPASAPMTAGATGSRTIASKTWINTPTPMVIPTMLLAADACFAPFQTFPAASFQKWATSDSIRSPISSRLSSSVV